MKAAAGAFRVLRDGAVFEQASAASPDVSGNRLPPSAPQPAQARARRHPPGAPSACRWCSAANPYHPDHARQTPFPRRRDGENVAWWFGGGFDLTPFYPFDGTCPLAPAPPRPVRAVRRALRGTQSAGATVFLPRAPPAETRGVGVACSSTTCTPVSDEPPACARSATVSSMPTCRSSERRKHMPYGERERQFQTVPARALVEFNLVCDRGAYSACSRAAAADRSLIACRRWCAGNTATPEPGGDERRSWRTTCARASGAVGGGQRHRAVEMGQVLRGAFAAIARLAAMLMRVPLVPATPARPQTRPPAHAGAGMSAKSRVADQLFAQRVRTPCRCAPAPLARPRPGAGPCGCAKSRTPPASSSAISVAAITNAPVSGCRRR